MIKDRDENMLVELPSKNFKVNPSDDLMEEIFSLTNVQPVLN
jgi:DNA polymerase-3 subunit alpha